MIEEGRADAILTNPRPFSRLYFVRLGRLQRRHLAKQDHANAVVVTFSL